jgi:hypothetical protein
MRDSWAALDDPPFKPTNWHLLGGYDMSACGRAHRPGTTGATFTDGGCGTKSTIHELGHNFGLGHSNVMDPVTGKVSEYVDRSGVMGAGAQLGLHAANYDYLKLRKDDEVRRVHSPERLSIVPAELPPEARHVGETPFNIVRPKNYSGRFHGVRGEFCLSIRKTKGHPHRMAMKQGAEDLFIHLGSYDTHLLDRIAPGESSTVIPGVTVHYVIRWNDRAIVDVYYDGEAVPDDSQPIEYGFPPADGSPLIEQDSGIWWHPCMNGQGFDVHHDGNKQAVYWYTFSEEYQGREWFFLDHIGDGDYTVLRATGGTFDDPASTLEDIGDARILTTDKRAAGFWYETDLHGRGYLPLQKLTHRAAGGVFYNKQYDGEGFTVNFDGERVVGYWFTYTNKGKRAWYLFDGHLSTGGEYYCDLYSASGGFIEYNLTRDPLTRLGAVTLTTKGANAFRFVSDIPKLGRDYVAHKLL